MTHFKMRQIVPIIALLLFLGIVSLVSFFQTPLGPMGTLSTYPESDYLSTVTDFEFQDYSTYFRKVAEEKGGAYAFEILKRARIAQGTDIHLVAHVVGDVLYKQEGIDGIKVCTPDFRNACSHSIVVGMLTEHGEGSLPEITATCKQAPGGKGAYTMCFHGLGHGVLAFNGYKFDKAVEMCKKTGTPEYQDREYIECVGGATMEMVAGVHDRDVWEKERVNYFKKDDPLYPCDASFMPKEVRPICYIHLTPYLFERAGMNLGKPDPSFYAKAFSFCDALPSENVEDRIACFGGFGKEFTVLAQERDVRDVGSMGEQALSRVREWCSFAGNDEGERACHAYALGSLFWGGEANPDASFKYCALLEDGFSPFCYEQLAGNIRTYVNGSPRGQSLCARLPAEYRPACSEGAR